MLFEEMLLDEKEEGKQTMSQLIQLLFKQNRMDDILKASENVDYREKLLKEFHLDNQDQCKIQMMKLNIKCKQSNSNYIK